MKIAIIGAGACGLMLATQLEKNNIDYDIYNVGKVGNKILASGNGRCNISNAFYNSNNYHNNTLALELIKAYKENLFTVFNELKIYTKCDSEGRMYPISESSQSVLNAFLNNIKKEIIDLEIKSIKEKNTKYFLNDNLGPYDKVVLSIGSIASYKKPYIGFEVLNNLDIKFNEFKPSLVGFKTNLNFKKISGCRCKAYVSLYQNDTLIHGESGEVIFKDNGISGICIMNLSSYYSHLKNNNNCYVELKLIDKEYDDYITIFNPKLLNYIIDNNINPTKFIVPISTTYDFELAQVCVGGIDISQINNDLSLKKYPNIYAGGEIIDFDGVCGGYNLMLAFACALAITKGIIK